MSTTISFEEAVPLLLEAAMHDEPMERLKEMARTNPALASGTVMRAWHDEWTRLGDLDSESLAALIRLLTTAENELEGWLSGSVSAVIPLFLAYAHSNPNLADGLADWVLGHTANFWLQTKIPLGPNSLREYRGRTATAAENATSNIFGAIQRGDVSAVQALLLRGADLTARDDSGRTPLDYALLHGRCDIIDVLTASSLDE